MLSADDHKRIAEAVSRAEEKTSGEIFCVLAREVSNYREVPLLWAAFIAFLAPPLAILLGLHRIALAGIFTSWTDPSARATENLILRALSSYELVQLGLFLVTAIIVAQPAVRRLLTPRALIRHRVRQVARHHFTAAGFRLSDAEPHVLIYASLCDRQVEIVAHKKIHDIVGAKVWDQAASAVVDGMKNDKAADGFARAVQICGDALAAHFPSTGPKRNQMPDDIVEM